MVASLDALLTCLHTNSSSLCTIQLLLFSFSFIIFWKLSFMLSSRFSVYSSHFFIYIDSPRQPSYWLTYISLSYDQTSPTQPPHRPHIMHTTYTLSHQKHIMHVYPVIAVPILLMSLTILVEIF